VPIKVRLDFDEFLHEGLYFARTSPGESLGEIFVDSIDGQECIKRRGIVAIPRPHICFKECQCFGTSV
jgi:hypothetical protein